MSQCSTSAFAETKARPEDAAEVGDGVQTTLEEGVQMVAKVCVASYFLGHVSVGLQVVCRMPDLPVGAHHRCDSLRARISKLFGTLQELRI
jgi:hypothetical protein